LPSAARAGMSFCIIPVDGCELFGPDGKSRQMAESFFVTISNLDGIIPVDGYKSWVTAKLPDGIIPIDGQIPVNCCESRVKIKLSKWLCKNHDSCASAGSPIDLVSAAGSVRVPQDLIS
jgi:hypothetical protein